jgi:hypothetical protein
VSKALRDFAEEMREEGGLLIDAVVRDSSELWESFWAWAIARAGTEFCFDNATSDPPLSVEDVFELQERGPVLLRFQVDGAQLNCHFFGGDIELDINSRQVSDSAVFAIARFLQELSDHLGHPVALTPEGLSEDEVVRFQPSRHPPQ